MKPVDFAQSARKHKIGRAHARYVIEHNDPARIPVEGRYDTLQWIGVDETGRELEIVAVDFPDAVKVIHVMPTMLRRL